MASIAICASVCVVLAGCHHPRTVALSGATAASGVTTIHVDVTRGRHRISPLIYGVAFATTQQIAALHVPSNRDGGNARTRYNWLQNCSNRAKDWYFESIQEDSKVPGASEDEFVKGSKAGGAQPILTVPALGWVAKVQPDGSKLASYSVAKYGSQQYTDNWMPDAGNGIRPDGSRVTGNDPNDANQPSSPAFERPWLQHLVSRWGSAKAGGVRYFLMDNEPGLWHDTHRDVHPDGASMAEVLRDVQEYGALVKSCDPKALVCGPEEWSYLGAIESGYDLLYNGNHRFGKYPDRRRWHGWLYYPWLLDQLRQTEDRTGQRLLDVLTVHYYPQGGEYGDDVSEEMQLRRNRSTRSLWDPKYVDETWVKDTIRLIPRLHEWTARYYPGTKIGITEYNWGAEKHINGATTEADVLGIFGREGLDMANYWTTPHEDTPVYNVFRLYRNYDGHRGSFGNIGVAASAPDPDRLSAFASVRQSDRAITVMVINKALRGSAAIEIALRHAAPKGVASVWQLTAGNRITRLPDEKLSGESLKGSVPAQSVTLFVLPPKGA